MKQKKEVCCAILCAVCAVLYTGCGTEEKEERETAYAGVSVLPEWGLEERCRNDKQNVTAYFSIEGPAAEEVEIKEPQTPLLEQLFAFEKHRYDGMPYITITGIGEEYEWNEWNFWKYMEEIRDNYGSKQIMLIPSDINGIPVKEIASGAFADRQMYGVIFPDTVEWIGEDAFQNTGLRTVVLSENLEEIGARAFENCNLSRVAFPDKALLIGERAFAENQELWTVLIPDVETEIREGAFEGCAPQFLLCYGTGQEEKRNAVLPYAQENGMETMTVIASKEPVVNYHDEPLMLKPEVRNFFYGDDGDYEKDQWCTWEEDVNAPNFGYSDWQWGGCSSWCACIDFECNTRASSELASGDGRYAAGNVVWQNRDAAWAEGAEGPGIGESILYRQSCTYSVDNQWEELTWEDREPVRNGLYGYTEICIVNGYAKSEKTWEENGRIKRLAMYVEGQLYAWLELEDTILPQYFMLPEGDIVVPNRAMLEVRFVIEEVYPGSLYEDTCLTGLVMEFSGRHSH